MQTRTTITHSCREKMKASITFLLCAVVGSAVGYYPGYEPYYFGNNDAVEVNANYLQQPSQRLFWGNNGSNQVGGTGWWATLTNKFPILGQMFGRMQLAPGYGVPGQYSSAAGYQPQFYQAPNYFQQQYPRFNRGHGPQFIPMTRDVAITDDAVIVTPPLVPIVPQPAPFPVPQPTPQPAPQPQPANEGYQYNKPWNRLELPQK